MSTAHMSNTTTRDQMGSRRPARRLANELGCRVDRRRVSAPGAVGRKRVMAEDD